ncbi:MAG: hypothetical protein JWM27_4387 [Gemmatimonadetes bacterium]|nr:hypothetical protein [Gemmatimonadota bacterium]
MSHLDEGALMSLLDGELPPGERAAAERHVAACAVCAAGLRELETARAAFAGAVQAGDGQPAVAAALMAVRRRSRMERVRPVRRALVRAAALVVGFAGIAYAATPGSPVRHWIARLAAPASAPAAPPALREAPPAAEAAPVRAGVSIVPEDGGVRVILSGSSPDLRVRARVSDGERAEVFATGAAAAARFRTGPGRVEIVGARGGEVTVQIPRGARTAVVEADGRVLLSREAGRLRVLAPVLDDAGPGMVFRVGP